MKPAYMPFSVITGETIKRISTLGRPFILLQPVSGDAPDVVKKAEAAGDIEVCAPVQGDEAMIREAVNKFNVWGAAHQGHMDAFKAMSGEGDHDEAFAAEIRSDILRGEPRRDPSDPMAAARLFLALAREFDMQQMDLQKELESSEFKQKKMFSELKGEEAATLMRADRYMPEDPGHYLTAKRILSWLRLLSAQSDPPRVWVTDSRAVYEYMREHVPQAKQIRSLIPLPGDASARDALQAYCTEIVESREPEGVPFPETLAAGITDRQAAVSILSLPFAEPEALLECLLSGKPPGSGPEGQTILFLFEGKG